MSEPPSTLVERLVAGVPVIPVIVIDDLEHALPLARALVEGGLAVLEVTLRTPAALARFVPWCARRRASHDHVPIAHPLNRSSQHAPMSSRESIR